MTTYEEDTVDIYYNLEDYFTMKNIPFSAIKKRPGGAGRGEIDILAVKIKNEKIVDCVHAEVSVSISSPFPSVRSPKHSHIDELGKIIKKFFKNDAKYKIKEIIGKTKYKEVFITSNFRKNAEKIIAKNIKSFGGKILKSKMKEGELILKIKYKKKIKEIVFIPFTQILEKLRKLFKDKNLKNKNFQDPRLRGLQYLIKKI